MSFITPSTAVEGSVVTSAIWNSDVRDNLSYLYSEGTARIAAGSALAGSITIAGDYLNDVTYSPVGTITSDYIVGTADLNKTYQVDPSGGTININIDDGVPTGLKVDFVQTGSGTVKFSNDWTARESNRYWVAVASSSDGTKLAAVVYGGYVYTSTNSGVNWTEQTGSGSRNWSSIASSSDGTKLVAVEYGGQIYTSTDSGATWTARATSGNWYDVASSADGTKLVAVVYGSQIYTSIDSGATWIPRDSNRNWSSVASSSDGTKLVAVVNGGQIYTSDDSGNTWSSTASIRTWRSVASSSDGTKLVAGPNGYIWTSSDSGATWTEQTGSTTGIWSSVASSSDGTKLVACRTGGYIYTSTDSGVTWGTATAAGLRQWNSVASSADGTKLVASHSSGGFGDIYTYNSNLPTISQTPSNQLRTQYSAATTIKIKDDEWLLFGDLA